ncbi:MAG TPA: hypothetical protein VLF21_03690 [Candidatus Saccharimonadales bacterium]|nr:hypothetical protein [Candidatus Saccharimonadales bacterium]
METPATVRSLIPTATEAVGSFFWSAVILVVLYRNVIIGLLSSSAGIDEATLQAGAQQQLESLNHLPGAENVIVVAFWFGLFMLGYTAIYGVRSALADTRDQVKMQTQYTGMSGWQVWARRPAKQLGFAVGLFLLLVLTAVWLLPLWFGLADIYVVHEFNLFYLPMLFEAWTGLAINLYAIWITGKLVFQYAKL